MIDTSKTFAEHQTAAVAQAIGNQANAQTSGFIQHVGMHNFCPKCGVKREAAWNFCPIDGKSLYDTPAYGLQQGYLSAQAGIAGTIAGKA